MAFRAIDLFSGAGCSSAGARHAGFTITGAVNSWDIAAKTFRQNFPTADVVTARLTERSGPELFQKNLGRIDLILASPECSHHSIARGNKKRDEDSRRSGWYVMRMIDDLAPRWIVLENVPLMARWPGYGRLIQRLRKSYHITEQTLDAADFGAPQNRRRLFVIGDRLGTPTLVKPSKCTPKPASSILAPFGRYDAQPVYNGCRATNTIKRVELGISHLGRKRDFLIVYYGTDKAGGWQTLDRPLRTLTTLDRFGLVQWRGKEPTLRMLQVEELRRAMGLVRLRDERGRSVTYKLEHGSRRDKIKLLGNGVCAPVMRAIAGSLLGGEGREILGAE